MHQTALYDFFSTVLLLGALLWLGRTARRPGFMILFFTFWYSAVRVGTDFLRVDRRYFGLTGSQLVTITVGLIALGLLARYRGAPPRFAHPPTPPSAGGDGGAPEVRPEEENALREREAAAQGLPRAHRSQISGTGPWEMAR